MAILEKEVLINAKGNQYQNIASGEIRIANEIFYVVNIDFIMPYCTVKVTKICDDCGKYEYNKTYGEISKQRKRRNGKDYCRSCSVRKNWDKIYNSIPIEKSLISTHPELVEHMKYPEHARRLTIGSTAKEIFICKNCGCESTKYISNVCKTGFRCKYCSDGISYPEKFMFSTLNQIGIEFIYQKKFKWSNNRTYDFYLPSLNCIIETHGEQHIRNKRNFSSMGGKTFEEEKYNDKLKERLAKQNGIKNYIQIDCSESTLNYIKTNILKSKLSNIVHLENINWKRSHVFACSSIVKTVCELWNIHKSIKKIAKIMKISDSTIVKYLKQGNEIGWCHYNSKESCAKKVIQMDLDGNILNTYDSIVDASKSSGVNKVSISNNCRKTQNKAGNYLWCFKDEYNDRLKNNRLKLHHKNSKKIVQLTMEGVFIKIWDSAVEAAKVLGAKKNGGNIASACNGRIHSSLGFKWMHYEDYINLHKQVK